MNRLPDERAAMHRLNEEMGRALRAGPAPLTSLPERADDPLVVCGLIGGKDVGKSALVNALAQREVSEDREEIGEGTAGVVAYVYAEDEPHLRARLRLTQASGRAVEKIVTHDAEALRGLALLDLPDVTSTFESHAAVVRGIAPLLDRVVWLWDPVLAGDRLYAERVGPVVKDQANVWFALNKVDLLARDEARAGADAADLWEGWRQWFASMARTASHEAGLDGEATLARRLFMVAAAFPTQRAFFRSIERAWGDEALRRHGDAAPVVERLGARAAEDLERLREALLTPVSEQDAARIKAANIAAETASDRATMERHYGLSELHTLASEAPPQVEADFQQFFGAPFVETVAERLARRGMSTAELAERVLAARVQDWPLLPAVYWLIRTPVRWLGRRVMAEGAAGRADDLLRVDGVPLAHRVDGLLARTTARQSRLLDAFREAPEAPEAPRLAAGAQAAIEEAHEEVERGVVRDCVAARRRPGALRRSFVWIVLAWFIVLQPVLEGLLALINADEGGAMFSLDLGVLLRAAAVLVTTLGAGALLKGLAVTLLVYVLMLMTMYGRAVRDVRRARGGPAASAAAAGAGEEAETSQAYAERVRAALSEEVLVPVLEPFEGLRRRVEAWSQQLPAAQRGALADAPA